MDSVASFRKPATEKMDPIMLALEKESKGFDPSLYVEKGNPSIAEQRNWLITDAGFVTKFDDRVNGKLIFTE